MLLTTRLQEMHAGWKTVQARAEEVLPVPALLGGGSRMLERHTVVPWRSQQKVQLYGFGHVPGN